MHCDEKERLTRVYQAFTEKFHLSVAELGNRMGYVSKGEYERLQRASEEGRIHCEQARMALEQHIAAHGC